MILEYNYYGFPLTEQEIRKIAYEFADYNDIKGFSENKKIAGRHWFEAFMKRFYWFTIDRQLIGHKKINISVLNNSNLALQMGPRFKQKKPV